MNGYLATLAGQTKTIMDASAIQLTRESMAERMIEAAEAARETNRATIKTSQELHRQANADQMLAIGAVRTKQEQYRNILYCGGAALAVSLLWLIYPGWVANVGPQDWLWPERVAGRTRGEATLWHAGIRLMRAGNPEGWQAIVVATHIARENRDTITACAKAAIKTNKPVRCAIGIEKP